MKHKVPRKYLSRVSPSRLASIKKTAKPVKKERIVVHLGNVFDTKSNSSGIQFASKTSRYSKRFPETQFIGIDVQRLPSTETNWMQIKASFNKGLKKLKDNSASIISSEMSLGYYAEKGGMYRSKQKGYIEYTFNVIQTAYQKLKAGGKLMVAVEQDVVPVIKEALKKAGFKTEIKIRKLRVNELKRTKWLRAKVPEIKSDILFQIIAVK